VVSEQLSTEAWILNRLLMLTGCGFLMRGCRSSEFLFAVIDDYCGIGSVLDSAFLDVKPRASLDRVSRHDANVE
jgi:hypothetical protein